MIGLFMNNFGWIGVSITVHVPKISRYTHDMKIHRLNCIHSARNPLCVFTVQTVEKVPCDFLHFRPITNVTINSEKKNN